MDDLDMHIARRLRARRRVMDLTQKALACKLGVSFQAVAKYESAESHLSAHRLYDIARALDVPVSYFFDGLDDHHRVAA